MSTSTELHGHTWITLSHLLTTRCLTWDCYDSDFASVFLAEHGYGSGLLGFVQPHDLHPPNPVPLEVDSKVFLCLAWEESGIPSWIHSFTNDSIREICSAFNAFAALKSNRSRSWATRDPCWHTSGPSTWTADSRWQPGCSSVPA